MTRGEVSLLRQVLGGWVGRPAPGYYTLTLPREDCFVMETDGRTSWFYANGDDHLAKQPIKTVELKQQQGVTPA